MKTIDPSRAVRAAALLTAAMLETICDLGEVPSGHLYAVVMSRLSLDTYNSAIGTLVREGFITNTGDLLKPTQKGKDLVAKGRGK